MPLPDRRRLRILAAWVAIAVAIGVGTAALARRWMAPLPESRVELATFDAVLATVALGDRAERVEALAAAVGEVAEASEYVSGGLVWRHVAGHGGGTGWGLVVCWRGVDGGPSVAWRFRFGDDGLLRSIERGAWAA